jgi:hypothetical protein
MAGKGWQSSHHFEFFEMKTRNGTNNSCLHKMKLKYEKGGK